MLVFKNNGSQKITEVYLGSSEISIMELFCENSQRLKAANYFHKKNLIIYL